MTDTFRGACSTAPAGDKSDVERAARGDVQAFEGRIRLLKPDEPLPQDKAKDKRKSKDEQKDAGT